MQWNISSLQECISLPTGELSDHGDLYYTYTSSVQVSGGNDFTAECPLLDTPPSGGYTQPVRVAQDLRLTTRNLIPPVSHMTSVSDCSMVSLSIRRMALSTIVLWMELVWQLSMRTRAPSCVQWAVDKWVLLRLDYQARDLLSLIYRYQLHPWVGDWCCEEERVRPSWRHQRDAVTLWEKWLKLHNYNNYYNMIIRPDQNFIMGK